MGGSNGIGGGIVQSIYGNKMGKTAQKIAMAQQDEAQRQYDLGSKIVNEATVSGLANYDKALAAQERNIGRQEELVKNIDPAIIEASQQALRLLRGEQSSTLAPMQQQRDMQRQKLVNSLREQLGPGAETSTAGIQALTRFDSETNQLMSGAQQQALSNLGNIGSQFSNFRPDMLRQAGGFADIAQGRAGLQFQQNAALQSLGSLLTGTAGAQYTNDLMQAQKNNALTDRWMESNFKVGETWATMGAGSMGGGGPSGKISQSGNSLPSMGGYQSSNYGRIGEE